MTDTEIAEFSSADFDAADTADMVVMLNGRPTTWVWTFAGPGHSKTIAQTARLARERLQEARSKEEARVNGRKWKAPAESPDELRKQNVTWILERLLGWSAVKIDGEPLLFSEEIARAFLMDPKKASFFEQATVFLLDADSFTGRSATA